MKVSGRFVVVAILLLIGLIGGLTTLASATPPDPSWTCGIYDGADNDDVILLVTTETATLPLFLLPEHRQDLVVVRIPELAREPVPTATVSTLQARAPPA